MRVVSFIHCSEFEYLQMRNITREQKKNYVFRRRTVHALGTLYGWGVFTGAVRYSSIFVEQNS